MVATKAKRQEKESMARHGMEKPVMRNTPFSKTWLGRIASAYLNLMYPPRYGGFSLPPPLFPGGKTQHPQNGGRRPNTPPAASPRLPRPPLPGFVPPDFFLKKKSFS